MLRFQRKPPAGSKTNSPLSNMKTLKQELIEWLDTQIITSENIGDLRRLLQMPWNSEWNSFVRDETATREQPVPPALIPSLEVEKLLSPVEKDLIQTKQVLGTLISWLVRDLGTAGAQALLADLHKPIE